MQSLLHAAVCLRQHYAEGETTEPSNSPTEGDVIPMSKEELEQTVEAFRKDLGLKKDDPLDPFYLVVDSVAVEKLRESSCIDAKTKDMLAGPSCNEWSAMSLPLSAAQESWVVFLNDCHSTERQRVTLLEEYWHILSGHKLTKIAKIAGSFGRTYDSSEEHDAYFLASATLLPRDAVKRKVLEGNSADQIASAFGTVARARRISHQTPWTVARPCRKKGQPRESLKASVICRARGSKEVDPVSANVGHLAAPSAAALNWPFARCPRSGVRSEIAPSATCRHLRHPPKATLSSGQNTDRTD